MRFFRFTANPAVASLILFSAAVVSACQSKSTAPAAPAAVSPDTWATVDGRAITRDSVEKAFRRSRDTAQPMSDEEAMTTKLTILSNLITQDVLLAKATALKIDVPEADLDKAYNDAKKNIPDEAFQQELSQRGLTVADMRDSLKRDLLTQKLLDQEVSAKVNVTDQEVNDFFNANRAQFNIAEESYRIAQIVITPVKDPQITNGTGDDATTPAAADAKLQMLMERLKAGATFSDLAMGYSEDAESAPRGGDLGLVPISRLRQAPPQLRDAVLNKAPGTVSIASQGNAHTLVLVIAHEPAGQRDLSTPAVKTNITNALRGRKEQLLRTAYLTAVQNDAKVQNYLAKQLVESKGGPPSVLPAAPKKP